MSPWLSDLLLRSQTDERLIALAQLGHKRAFELIDDRYRRPLTAYAQRIDPHRAEDLVQQTFLSALSALQRGTEVRHLRGWLYEILRNQARRDHVTSAALAELDEADSVTDSAQLVAERRMLAVDALGAVAQLPARQQDAIVQMAFQGLSRTEVASAMGLSEGAVRQLVHRARAAVRTAVTAITPMPILRWLYIPRSAAGTGLTEATLGAGTASGAGIVLKVGVGAIVASGVVAGGVISAVSPHHRLTARTASHTQSASGRPAAGAGVITNAPVAAERSAATRGRTASGLSTGHGQGASGGQFRFTLSQPSATVGGDGPGSGRDGGSGSDSRGSGGRDGGSSSGRGDGGGSSGPGSGDRGSTGSDGGGTGSGSGSGTDGGSGSGTSDGGSVGGTTTSGTGTSGGGTDGGGGSQPTAPTSSHDGGGSGTDGGSVSSGGGTGPTSGSDGGSVNGSGSLTGSASGTSGSASGTSGSTSGSSGSTSGPSSDTGLSSDGGSISGTSSSSDGGSGSSGSGSGSLSFGGH